MSKSEWQNSFKTDVSEKIKQLPGNIVLRQDVNELGGYRQVSRALNNMIEKGELIKLGKGIYSKTFVSPYRNIPVIKEGFDNACKEALTRLGVKFELGEDAKAYNAGKSTQLPVRAVIRLKSRFRTYLAAGGRTLKFEENIYAR